MVLSENIRIKQKGGMTVSSLLLSIFCILAFIPIAANAAAIQLPRTGQTTVYSPTDDRAVRVGKQWPSPSLCDNGDETVTDNLTGLIWAGDGNLVMSRDPGFDNDGNAGDGAISWQHALDYIKKLNAEKFRGHGDWRLPNINELASLVNQGEADTSLWLTEQGFKNTQPHRYWSSTNCALYTAKAWTIDMESGTVDFPDKSQGFYLLPVRGGETEVPGASKNSLPKTGQTACYDENGALIPCGGTGQDGELQIGVFWPNPRFIDNNDLTVTDRLTGLIWAKDANLSLSRNSYFAINGTNYEGAVSWQDALNYVTMLNQDSYLGFSDWRLPNRNELVSLVNYMEANSSVWLTGQGILNTRNHYWSSGTVAGFSNKGWNVRTNGAVHGENKVADSSNNYTFFSSFVWPVRVDTANTQTAAATLSITTATLADGYVNISYSRTLTATGGTTPYTWSRTGGTLPTGLSLSSTGFISGKPTASGTNTFTIQVKDKASKTATKSLSITVYSALSISTANLPAGSVGVVYNQNLNASGGKTPYTWSISSGTLPAGLSLNASTGVISGTPTTNGTKSLTFKVTDANGKTASKSISITINAAPPTITTTALADGYGNYSYSQTLAASGGKTPYSWSLASGSLPVGLTLAASTGVITGMPTTIGTSSFTVKVKDANNASSTKTLSISVYAYPAITTEVLPTGAVGSFYSQTVPVTGGKPPYSWALTGNLPNGLALDASTGVISGTPLSAGNKNFGIAVTDNNGTTYSRAISITINPALSISTSSLLDNYVGSAYSQNLMASGGLPPYNWQVVNGTLPAGLSLNANTGAITGSLSTVGSITFSVRVTDTGNATAVKDLSITVFKFPSIGGSVTDLSTGAPLAGVNVVLALTGIASREPADRVYSCNDTPITGAGYGAIAMNDSVKFSCSTVLSPAYNTMLFKVRNPFGADPFTVDWNGITSLSDVSTEYLAQRFTPNISGKLTSVSFYLPSNFSRYVNGDVHVLLKSELGGDRGIYLAISDKVSLNPLANSAPVWIDFTFPSPVAVSAGQVYYLEINGFYLENINGGSYLYDFLWSKSDAYAGGGAFKRSGGLWQQVSGALAFRTFVDDQPDLVAAASASTIPMYGGNRSEANGQLFNTPKGNWGPNLSFNTAFSDSDGYRNFNGGDLSGGLEMRDGAASYYDQNGWLTVKMWAYSPLTAYIITDQFKITFNRTLTAVTDANGAYSFPNLPDGNYTLLFYKNNYADKIMSGVLLPGQDLSVASIMESYSDTVINTDTLPNGFIGYYYDQTLKATGSKGPYTWSLFSGSLPTGLSFSASDGWIYGNPSAPGRWDFTVQVKGSDNVTVTKALSILVYANAGNIKESTLPNAPLGVVYNQSLAVIDSTNAPFTWSIAGGTLPAGLTLNSSTGAITGTPTIPYVTSYFYVLLKDASNTTSIRQFSISVSRPPAVQISTTTLPDAYTGAIYRQSLTVTGGLAPYTWSIFAGTQLPAGLTLNSSTGVISGTPTATGRSSFTVRVNDGYSSTTKSLSINVALPPFTVRNLGDTGNVTVMEATGNYDAKNADGSINDLPRRMIATEYFKAHGDIDFLVLLTTFDFTLPEAGAQGFYLGVKNDVQGINQAIFDNSSLFGSLGRLQGTIDMGNVTALAAAPYGPKLDQTVTTLNHELMHRFGAYVRFKNPNGTLNTALLGRDSAHWSYLLDTQGSIMYGNGWKENGNGTFTSIAKMDGYSPLDLYLMGMIPKEQVPQILLIDNPAIDKTQLPLLGATISGTAKTVTIEDIIAAEGARVPDAASSPKRFNVWFVLLTRPGDSATAAVQAIETVRTAFAGRFAELTWGIGGLNGVAPSLAVQVDSPSDGATITGPDATVTGTVINTTGAETGVTVNGVPATVSGSSFIVNHVPLQTGANTLTITATDANGLTSSAARSVTAAAGNYIRITSNIESGVTPLDISLRLDGSFSIANPTVTASGPVAVTLTPGTNPTEFTATLTVEGTYTFTASAVGPDSQSYSDTVTVTVVSRQSLETILKGKWEGMKQKVITGDTQGAGPYFPLASRDMFQAIFTDSTIDSVARMNDITAIEIYTISNGYAQGGLIRHDEDGVFSYPISFTKDELGLWRIYNF
jgi:hypothetical protein